MRKQSALFWGTIIVVLVFVQSQSFSQEEPYEVPVPAKHTIVSEFVNQTFEIHVQLPVRLKDGSERFPVLYLTDCVSAMLFDDITALMQTGGDVPRFIMVGIGYPAANWMGGMQLRARDLTPTEFDLLYHLMSHAGQVFASERLLQEVWDFPYDTGSTDLVRAHVKNLRAKIEPDPRKPTYLRTVPRHGYMIAE